MVELKLNVGIAPAAPESVEAVNINKQPAITKLLTAARRKHAPSLRVAVMHRAVHSWYKKDE